MAFEDPFPDFFDPLVFFKAFFFEVGRLILAVDVVMRLATNSFVTAGISGTSGASPPLVNENTEGR